MSYLFSKQDPTEVATRTACSKLSNNAALMVSELAREPAQGLMHVVVSVSVTHSKFFGRGMLPLFHLLLHQSNCHYRTVTRTHCLLCCPPKLHLSSTNMRNIQLQQTYCTATNQTRGMMHGSAAVQTHVQRSIPTLLDTHHQLEAAAVQLQVRGCNAWHTHRTRQSSTAARGGWDSRSRERVLRDTRGRVGCGKPLRGASAEAPAATGRWHTAAGLHKCTQKACLIG